MISSEDRDEIRREVKKLLIRADALGQRPTPVEPIVHAARLTEPKQSLLGQVALFGKSVRKDLQRALEKATSKILAMVDFPTATIHLDPTIDYEPQKRFLRLHEVGHTLPWQRDVFAYLDDASALSALTSRLFERQANFAAALLAFQIDQFGEDATDYATGLAGLLHLAGLYEMSLRASLWQYAESHRGAVCGLVIDKRDVNLGEAVRRLEVRGSSLFEARFGWPFQRHPRYLHAADFDFVPLVCASQMQPLRVHTAESVLTDVNGDSVNLSVDAYSTRWHTLVLLWIPDKQKRRAKKVTLVDRSGAPLRSVSAA